MPLKRLQTSFTFGEVDPEGHARQDVRFYDHGAKRCRNVRLRALGGASRRHGTIRLEKVFEGEAIPDFIRVARFAFSENQSYAVLFYHEGLKVFFRDELVETIETDVPWTEDELPEINWAQSADTMIIVHKKFQPRILRRTGLEDFELVLFEWEQDADGRIFQPYYKYAQPGVTVNPGSASGQTTLVTNEDYFQPEHEGRMMRVLGEQVLIQDVNSPTEADAEWVDGGSNDEDDDFQEEMFSPLRGWPSAITFYDQRLWFGGGQSLPGALVGSKVNAFFNFDDGDAEDNDSIQRILDSDEVNEIRHLVPWRQLQVLTNDGEYYVPQREQDALTPINVRISKQTSYGVAWARPIIFDGATMFLQEHAGIVREFLWSDAEQAHTSDSVSLVAQHLVQRPIQAIAVHGPRDAIDGDQHAENYAFMVDQAGYVACLHSIRSEQVLGWSRWDTDGKVMGMVHQDNVIYWFVRRELANGPELVFERLTADQYVDGMIESEREEEPDGDGLIVFMGFDAYEGMEVEVMSGNYNYGRFTVGSDGSVRIPEIGEEKIQAGLTYSPMIETLPPNIATNNHGDLRGQPMRIWRTKLLLEGSLYAQVNGQSVTAYRTIDNVAEAPPLRTGTFNFRHLGWSPDPTVKITQAAPGPFTALGIVKEIRF